MQIFVLFRLVHHSLDYSLSFLFTVFDEDFVFEVPGINLNKRTLEVLLYDFDAYSRHHSIGGMRLPLSEVDFSEKVNIWRNLMPVCDRDSPVDLGELMVSFSYLPSAERLTVVVIKARNLRVVDDTRTASGAICYYNCILSSSLLNCYT